MKAMSAFEKWQVVTSVIQTVILLGALLVALYIGLKQADISSTQTEISKKQSDISESLLDLQYAVSVEIAYDSATKHLNIANRGQGNLYLWGDKLRDADRSIEKEPRLITPGGFYYIIADDFESLLLDRMGQDGEATVLFEVYLSSQRGAKYVVHAHLLVQITAGKVAIHSQTTSIEKSSW